jgi:hypothetical protein
MNTEQRTALSTRRYLDPALLSWPFVLQALRPVKASVIFNYFKKLA